MIFSSRNHAIGTAHFQIAGGIKSLMFLLIGYVLLVGLILGAVLYNTPPEHWPQALRNMTTLFLMIEGFGIVVMGAMRVAGSIRLDLTNNMIESHRQMPVSAAQAIFDYLTGTTVHVGAVIVLHVVVLSIMAGVAGLNLESFVLAQMVLVAFALFIWNFAAMGALMFRQAVPVIVLLFIFGSCGSMFLHGFGLLPGFSLLTAPFLGETIFSAGGIGGPLGAGLRQAYPVALVAQGVLGALCFIGACRRYRGAYLTTFNVPMGWVLLATWGLLSAFSIVLWPGLNVGVMRGDFGQPTVQQQIVAALCVSGLLLIVPAHALATWEVRHGLSKWRRAGALAAMVLCAATVLPVARFAPMLWLATVLVLTAHAVTALAALRLFSRFTPMTVGIAMVLLLGAIWIVPLLIESVRWYFLTTANPNAACNFTLISTLSPLGALLSAWTQAPEDAPPVWMGVIVQLAVAAIFWQLAYRRAAEATPTVKGPPPQAVPS